MPLDPGVHRFARRDGEWMQLQITGYFTQPARRYEVQWEDGATGFLPCTAGIFRHAPPNPRTLTKPAHTAKYECFEAGKMKVNGDENLTPVAAELAVGISTRVEAGRESTTPLGESTNRKRCLSTSPSARKRARRCAYTPDAPNAAAASSRAPPPVQHASPPRSALQRARSAEAMEELETAEEAVSEHSFDSLSSVPVHVDATFVAATRDLEEGSVPKLDGISRDNVLREHGSFSRYRLRLLHAMLRRAWFSALTDVNMSMLFPPGQHAGGSQEFVRLIKAIVHSVRTELLALKAPTASGGAPVSVLLRRGLIKLVLKGGNSIFLLAQSTLSNLQHAPAKEALRALFGKNVKLSDIDFMLTICPAVEHFAEVHVAVCAAVRGALARVRNRLCQDVRKSRPDHPNFAAFHNDVGQEGTQRLLREAMDKATGNVQQQLVAAWESEDALAPEPVLPNRKLGRDGCEDQQGRRRLQGEASLRPLLVELDALRFKENACNSISMAPRRDLDIWCEEKVEDDAKQQSQGTSRRADGGSPPSLAPGGSRRVHCRHSGRAQWLYLSENTSCDFMDCRGRCRFALIRMLVGYRSTHPRVRGFHAHHNSHPLQPLLKGELVDISIPFFEDHSLDAVWSDVNLFVEPSKLNAARPRLAVTLDMESVDALLREQSDLTFGPRMQQMEVWQVRKVEKRLPRLIILAGLKSMMLPYPIEAIVDCWCGLVQSLEKFLQLCQDFEPAQPPLLGEWNMAGAGFPDKSARMLAAAPCAQSKSGHRRRSMHHAAIQGENEQVRVVPKSGRQTKVAARSVPSHGARSLVEKIILEESGLNNALLSKLTHKLLKDTCPEVIQAANSELRAADYQSNWAQVVQLLIEPAKTMRDVFKSISQNRWEPWMPLEKVALYTLNVPGLWRD